MQPAYATLLLSIVTLLTVPIQAAERQFVLREQLGRRWTDELVRLPFKAAPGECHRDSLRLEGPHGPVAMQLLDAEWHTDAERFVRRGRIALVVDLPPRVTQTYTLRFGPQAAAEPTRPTSPLRVTAGEGSVEVVNGRFGARLLVGQKGYDPPAAAEDVPGPLLAMRLPDGRWFGGSRMFGSTKLTGYTSELTAAGPVVAEVRYCYRYADGNELRLRAQLGSRDTAVYWDMDVARDAPRDGWRLILSRGLPPLTFPVQMEFYSRRPCFVQRGAKVGDWAELPLNDSSEPLITRLTPWGDWWDDYTQTVIRLNLDGCRDTLLLASRDPGTWVKPAAPGDWNASGGRKHKMMPLGRSSEGDVYLEANLAAGEAGGVRRWLAGIVPPQSNLPDAEFARRVRNREIVARYGQRAADKRRLDHVKDLSLDWPCDPSVEHPHLFVSGADIARYRARGKPHPEPLALIEPLSREEIRPVPSYKDGQALAAWLVTGNPEVARKVKLPERLRRHLGLLGNFDLMRNVTAVCAMYDGLIDGDLIPDEEKPLLRAQMAYLGYRLADPATWSMERGYTSGNPNMSVSYLLGLGMIACTIPDHPKARAWAEPAMRRVQRWLDEDVGPRGEWIESAHYAHVTGSMLMAFAIAAQNAGFHDYSRDERLKRMMLYLAKQYTPPDPTRGGHRLNPPLGRANAGARPGLAGAMARLTAASDPKYSRTMQWVWQETGHSYLIYDNRLAGTEYIYLDPALPAEKPNWQSELFPRVGAVLRHAFATRKEHYVSVLLNGDILFARPSEVGSVLKWFAYGQPIAGAFTGGYEHRHELLNSRVVLARSPADADAWYSTTGYRGQSEVAAFSTDPRLDYVDARFTISAPWHTDWKMPEGMPRFPVVEEPGKPPVRWRRQMLFVKGKDAAGPCYLVLRDTVRGGRPTMWHFWTLSDGVVEADRATAAVGGSENAARDPVEPCQPAWELTGDRFTALGQNGIDLEYFVAAPRDTPRHTLRYGTQYTYPIPGFKEHQDLLQLRLTGDGHYSVVLFPRRRGERRPKFRGLAGGAVIEVSGDFGTDYVLLSDEPVETAVGDDMRLEGTAGCVQRREGKDVLVLAAPGLIRCAEHEVRKP